MKIITLLISALLILSFILPQLIKAQVQQVTIQSDFLFEEKVIIGDENEPSEEDVLNVYGHANFTGPVSGGTAGDDNHFTTLDYVDQNIFWMGVGLGDNIATSKDSNVNIGGIDNPSLRLSLVDPGLGFDRISANVLGIYTNNTERMRITSNGNVGINTTTPGHQLDVVGSTRFSNTVEISTMTDDLHAVNVNYVNSAFEALEGIVGDVDASKWTLTSTNLYPNLTTQNVIIGDTSPDAEAKLTVVDGNITGTHDFQLAGDIAISGINGSYIQGKLGIGSMAPNISKTLTVSGNASIGSNYFSNEAPANGLIVEGNVGIGTNNPNVELEVAGAIKLGDTTLDCDASIRGTIKYVEESRQSYVCDGIRWLNLNNCGIMTDDEGNTYATVQIGGQCWMAENLRYLPAVSPGSDGSTTVPHYYVYGYQGTNVAEAKNHTNYSTHGVLYNWPAAMNGSEVAGARGACPAGWHVPTDTEWNILEKTVVGIINSSNPQYPCSLSETGWRRCADDTNTEQGANGVGQALKELGLGTGVGEGTDLVGFASKLSGYRHTNGGFHDIASRARYWSSSSSSATDAWFRIMDSSYSTVCRTANHKGLGFSLRCLKD